VDLAALADPALASKRLQLVGDSIDLFSRKVL